MPRIPSTVPPLRPPRGRPRTSRRAPRALGALAALALVSVACEPDPKVPGGEPPVPATALEQSQQRLSVIDSIKSRREYAFRTRPDTFGARVDSQRIVRSARGDSVPWVVVFSDFQCEDCRRLALEVLPALRRDIVERGIANLAFVAAPRDGHFNARFAAIAALCAGSAGRFWPVHDSLFAALPRWERDPDPRAYMDSIAVAAGVPAERQRDCVDRNRLLRLLDGDIMRSATSRVVEVPTVFVGDQRLPSSELTLGGIRRAVEAAARTR